MRLVAAEDLVEACWSTGGLLVLSGVLKRVAVKLSKTSNDLRLLSSGLRGGLGEIRLPAVQPRSSIMPGKVNAVISEAVNQACFQVTSITNIVLSSMELPRRVAYRLRVRCVAGMVACEERRRELVEVSHAIATALNPLVRYDELACRA